MTTETGRRQIIPPSMQAMYDAYHFAPATRVGETIWVSGQVGLGPDMRPGVGMEAQARFAFANLKTVLEAAGAELADVVELVTFHTDLRGDMAAFAKVKDEVFPTRYPAWTAVGVTQLASEAFLVEVRAVAVAGSGQG